ncbi:MAG: MOSC domain-containing protein [Actinobacteria bacterium]|nr:MAG: MOSC domain-containing protein [Actinomycetota bacterium]
MTGRVEGIFVTETHGKVPQPIERVRAVPGGGLVGNRYFYADGDAPPGRAITLVAAEAVEAFVSETGIEVTAAETRRNVVTRGIDVNALVGKRFRIGDVECVGVELCEPCSHLESMTKPGVLKGLVHRAGLNADVLNDGEISVGDAVTAD